MGCCDILTVYFFWIRVWDAKHSLCFFLQGNIENLYNTDLEGNAAAAVEDCSQRFAIYFDFAQLDEIQAREGLDRPAWLPPEPFDPKACVFNRGVLVVDSKRWIEENITSAIIWWMDEFQKSERNLYK